MAESVKAAGMDEFKQTPYYQGLGIEALRDQLAGFEKTDGELTQQAEAQYRGAYENELEAARQALEKEVQGYGSELAETGAAYDRQRRLTNQAYEESAVKMNNELNRRGLGRSSLVSAQGAYLQNERNRALADIDRAETDAVNAINEKIALLTGQAAERERTMAGNYARQLQSRVDELKEQNRSASISLQLQIAALQQQGYEAYQDWLLKNRQQEIKEKEFAAEYGGLTEGTGSGGSSAGKKPAGTSSGRTAGKQTTAQKPGGLSEKAGAAVDSLTEGIRKLIGGISAGMKAASALQKKTAAKGGSGAAVKTAAKAGLSGVRQTIKE